MAGHAAFEMATEMAGLDRMAMAGVNILDDALMVQARREAGAGANEQVIADIYTSLRNEYDAESPIDRAALDDADFMALKEFFGMAGIEALPVRGSSAGRGKGAQMTASDGTPIILVDTGALAGFDGVRNFVTAHEGYHAIDKLLGREGSITLAREIAASVPEFAKYKATLDSAHAAVKLAAPSETYAQNEAVADIFGQVFFKPQFLGAAIDAAVKNPAIGGRSSGPSRTCVPASSAWAAASTPRWNTPAPRGRKPRPLTKPASLRSRMLTSRISHGPDCSIGSSLGRSLSGTL
jgi:hypothetical protein